MRTTNTTKVNTNPIQALRTLRGPRPWEYQHQRSFKNIRADAALSATEGYIRRVIEQMLEIPSDHKFAYVDVKVQDLIPGQGTTKDGFWHLDSSLNGEMEYDNFLFVTGRHALTEFVETPLEVPKVESSQQFNAAVVSQDFKSRRIDSCTITRYNGLNVHRGPIATGREVRLLVRVVKTDRRQMPTGGI